MGFFVEGWVLVDKNESCREAESGGKGWLARTAFPVAQYKYVGKESVRAAAQCMTKPSVTQASRVDSRWQLVGCAGEEDTLASCAEAGRGLFQHAGLQASFMFWPRMRQGVYA